MSNLQLSSEQITALLQQDYFAKNGYDAPKQVGPLRWSDTSKPCTHTGYYVGGILRESDDRGGRRQGCHSPTYWRLNGQPMCSVHALYKMNTMLHELGKGVE